MRFQTKRTKAVSRRKFAAAGIAAACALVLALAGCSSGGSSSQGGEQAAEPAAEEQASLEGKELNIYCGAGMTDPFQEIADAFEAETGCTMNVTIANAAQIQTQITTTGRTSPAWPTSPTASACWWATPSPRRSARSPRTR